jgi:hypothetical protein
MDTLLTEIMIFLRELREIAYKEGRSRRYKNIMNARERSETEVACGLGAHGHRNGFSLREDERFAELMAQRQQAIQ